MRVKGRVGDGGTAEKVVVKKAGGRTGGRSGISRWGNDFTLKPTQFPEGFVLVQDTREQRPLFIRIPKGLTVASGTLKNGDYSIMGMEDKWCVERKQISDMVSYCAGERDKTIEKMKRFLGMDWVGLVIEAREGDLLRPYMNSRVSPEVVRQAIVSFEVRYGVHVYYNPDRDSIARWVLDRAVKYYKITREVS